MLLQVKIFYACSYDYDLVFQNVLSCCHKIFLRRFLFLAMACCFSTKLISRQNSLEFTLSMVSCKIISKYGKQQGKATYLLGILEGNSSISGIFLRTYGGSELEGGIRAQMQTANWRPIQLESKHRNTIFFQIPRAPRRIQNFRIISSVILKGKN